MKWHGAEIHGLPLFSPVAGFFMEMEPWRATGGWNWAVACPKSTNPAKHATISWLLSRWEEEMLDKTNFNWSLHGDISESCKKPQTRRDSVPRLRLGETRNPLSETLLQPERKRTPSSCKCLLKMRYAHMRSVPTWHEISSWLRKLELISSHYRYLV